MSKLHDRTGRLETQQGYQQQQQPPSRPHRSLRKIYRRERDAK